MADEITRNYLTQNTSFRRMRFYSVSLKLANGSAAGATNAGQISFQQGRYYLWTGTSVTAHNGTAGADVTLSAPYEVSWSKPSSNRTFQLIPARASDVAAAAFNVSNENAGGQYTLFTDNDFLQFNVNLTGTIAFDLCVKLTLSGIEYLP